MQCSITGLKRLFPEEPNSNQVMVTANVKAPWSSVIHQIQGIVIEIALVQSRHHKNTLADLG